MEKQSNKVEKKERESEEEKQREKIDWIVSSIIIEYNAIYEYKRIYIYIDTSNNGRREKPEKYGACYN